MDCELKNVTMRVEQFQKMESYTFAEGIAFLALVKAPRGVINHLKTTHNRSHLHSEIHKQLRIPRVKEIVRKNFDSTIARNPESTKKEAPSVEIPSAEESPVEIPIERKNESTKEEDPSVESTIERNPESTKEEDPSEIILTKEDIRTHENTRLEDMPNDLCRTLWLKRQDVYREMQHVHRKMTAVPEGEEHNEERAHWREEVLRLDAENEAYWQQIDKEIERFKSEQSKETPVEIPIARNPDSTKEEETPKKENPIPSFNLSTSRAYISKALRKKKLTPEQLVELQHRVDAMIAAKVEMKQETIEKLKAIGINVG